MNHYKIRIIYFTILLLVTCFSSKGQVLIGEQIKGKNIEDRFGSSVATNSDGSRIVVGSPGFSTNDNKNGYVNVYNNENGNWVIMGKTIDSPIMDARYGSSVSISKAGNRIAIGGPSGNIGGIAEIYDFKNNSWEKVGNTITGETADSQFGSSIEMSEDGNMVAIGAPFDFGSFQNSGSVRVYKLIGNDWMQIGETINGETFAESSGSTLALSADGKILIISAPNYNVTGNGSGIVRTYILQNNQWLKLDSDIKGQEKDMLGTSIDLSSKGLKLAIGASQLTSFNIGKGYVQVYEMINNEWIKIGQVLIGEQVNDNFGSAVSINSSGDLLTIGARRSDKLLKDAGKIDIYQLKNNEWIQIGNSIYGDHESEGIGSQLMISGDGTTFIVGSQFNDEVATNAGKVSVYNFNNLSSSLEMGNSREIIAFPNPVQHFMTIKHTDYNEFELLDFQGKIIKNLIIKDGQINFENLSSGVYYLICKSAINYKTIQVVKI